jgi:2-polyprenyl-3-methyl-5-hydroxy-6-metoxy-1,4-benzoquinol methylase
MSDPDETRRGTQSRDYTKRLETTGDAGIKRYFDVQAPYRFNIRRLDLGFTLDVGCGVGRNLMHLDRQGVGVDHNADSIAVAQQRGCTAFTSEAFSRSEYARPSCFDSLLMAHVVEHMNFEQACELVSNHLDFVRAGGQVVLISPQEAGYRSDDTHVEFMDFEKLEAIFARVGVVHERSYSFPFPRWVGKFFPHNEFVVVGRRVG